jgi:hypothetical protein
MECIICFEPTTKHYKIKCGSKVAHEICHSCETTLRLQSKPTLHGRTIKCPVCRKDENGSGNRTRASYEAELRMLYSKLYPRILPFERPVVHFQQYQTPVRVRVTPPPVRVPVNPVPVAPVIPVSAPAPVAPAPVIPVSAPAPVAPAPVIPVSAPAQVAPAPVIPVSAPAPVAPAPVIPVSAPAPVTPVSAPAPVIPVSAPAQVAPAPVIQAPVIQAPVIPVSAPAPVIPVSRDWCSNRHLQCPTKSKTTRKCTYPMGCENKVCRHCNMCMSHFEF